MSKISTITIIEGVEGKECSRCGIWKVLGTDFTKGPGIGGKKATCRECGKEQSKAWRQQNADRVKEYKDKYYQENRTSEIKRRLDYFYQHRDHELARKKKWHDANYEKRRFYYAKNRENYNLWAAKRRARKKSLQDDLTIEEFESLVEKFGGCALTGKPEDVHLDHVIPIAIGHGGTTLKNVIPLNKELNHSKSDSNIFDWFELNKDRFNLSDRKFEILVDHLAQINELTVPEYRQYVADCFSNPKDVDKGGES